ncbi:MAG TPA: hypothetical protein VGN10_15605 [Pyrinomonadaceae bacterium]|jgi:hypothetical protein
MKLIAASLCLLFSALLVSAQETTMTGSLNEQRVALTTAAVALDASGAPALEATLRTTALNGAPETPVTNVRIVVKNRSTFPYAFVSGEVTFYDAAGVRCGEGVFKADAVAVDESFESDLPGLRIRCEAATWRVIATSLLPRVAPNAPITALTRTPSNFVISIDGETHPIQLDKPLTVTLGEKRRTIIVRAP